MKALNKIYKELTERNENVIFYEKDSKTVLRIDFSTSMIEVQKFYFKNHMGEPKIKTHQLLYPVKMGEMKSLFIKLAKQKNHQSCSGKVEVLHVGNLQDATKR